MNEKKKEETFWSMGKDTVKDWIEQLGVTGEMMRDDFVALKDNGKEKLGDLLDEWAADRRIKEFFEGFLSQASQGLRSSKEFLSKKNEALQSYLEQQVRLTPHMVGGVDGFVQVYLAIPAKRWIRSPRYRKGVKTGRALGILCAVTLFLPLSLGRALIGLLPGASRFLKYFRTRWEDAKQKRSVPENEET